MKCKLSIIGFLICVTISAQAQKEIVVSPQWTAQAQFAGLYVAEAKGFYKEAGLNVRIEHHPASTSIINLLKSGKSQFITLHLVSAMKCIDQGFPVVNALQYSQQNCQMIVSHTPLNGIESLRGMKIGHWKTGFSELAFSLDHKYNLNIQWVPFISNINLYISKAIDATIVMSYNEFFQLQAAGQQIRNNQVLYFRDIGYNIPEDGIYTTPEYYKAHPNEVKKFAEATRKGWEWACENFEEALDIVMVYTQSNTAPTNRLSQKWMLREILNTLKDRKCGRRTYQLLPKEVELANRILLEGGVIKNKVTFQQITRP